MTVHSFKYSSTAIQAAHTHLCKFQFWAFLDLPEGSQQKIYRQEPRLLFLPQTAPKWLVTLTWRGGCHPGKSPGVAITAQQEQAMVTTLQLSVSNSNCDSVMPVKMRPDFRNRYVSKIFKAMNRSRLVTAVWWDLG